jgi:endo-1,4-beta-mannosidase
VIARPFRLGINYWPARTAMGWWRSFDATEVAVDFGRIASCGFDSVRIFLLWADFQPTDSQVDPERIHRLVETLDLAGAAGLSVMPTLFTGHMSGVNWIPTWALGGTAGDSRFRVVAGGEVVSARLADWYTDPAILCAQTLLARECASALATHPALLAWDLGNENSNCVVPPDKTSARDWLSRMTDAIRGADASASVTIGLHMEDLEHDRMLGPREAAEACDFLTMHGYPGYAAWAEGPTDERLLPFLTRITRWLGSGADVMFSEFGVPTHSGASGSGPVLVDEQAASAYVERGLHALVACGSTGAMLWCHADYAREIWDQPPLDLAIHERSFGVWRADGSAKPAAAAVAAFAQRAVTVLRVDPSADAAWIDIEADEFYRTPTTELPRLYRRYCDLSRPDRCTR